MNDVVTKDMHLAAALVAYGCRVCSVDRSDPHRQYFTFDRCPEQVYVDDGAGPVVVEIRSLAEMQSYLLSSQLWLPGGFVAALRSVKSYLFGGL